MSPLLPPPVNGALGPVTTDRLELRPFVDDDLDDLAVVFAKPEVWKYPYGRGFDRAETERFLQGRHREWSECGFGLWAAFHREDQRLIGYVGLSVPMFLPEILPAVEVGWRFDPDYWGHGLATEGALAALDAGFETLGLDEIVAVVEEPNVASSAVCTRIGMHLDRPVTIPATEQRGELEALLYTINAPHHSA